MKNPSVFIGSSSEGRAVAEAIQINMEKDPIDTHVWTQGVFEIGSTYIESLIEELDKADFAVLVLTEDDITISRNKETVSPRDNVLFELGLFMGKLGRDRCYFVYDNTKNIKLPSDLAGMSGATYRVYSNDDLVASLGPASSKIRNMIYKKKIREKADPAILSAYNQIISFSEKVQGYWWESIKPNNVMSISFIRIYFDKAELMLKMEGRSFDTDGKIVARWNSGGSGIQFDDRKLFYHWTGWFPSNPNESWEGFGEITFADADAVFMDGSGLFFNISVTDLKNITKQSSELYRSDEDDIKIMESKDKLKIAKLVSEKIAVL
jgi:hypothetical protein